MAFYTRERWYAFHRLYRLAAREQRYNGTEGGLDAMRDFCAGTRMYDWYLLLQSHGDTLAVRSGLKCVVVRKRFLEQAKNDRLYGDCFSRMRWAERDQVIARKCAQKGTEVTPLEVAAVRQKIIKKARALANEMGVPLPNDEAEVLRLIGPGLRAGLGDWGEEEE